jgi:serine/threonine protein kinase
VTSPEQNLIPERRCRECGAEIMAALSGGLCARCALRGALEPPEELSPTAVLPSGVPDKSAVAFFNSASKRFGDYELFEEIARGGMGIVWRARQVSLSRIVAVKMILSGPFAGKEELLRFRAEAEAAARLQHPNIVRIHETGEVDGQPYFSMDYIEGLNLAALVRQKPVPYERAAGYLKKIAEAIHYAHDQGILHRDLKPSNVLIDEHDEPHVTDFGLAKRMQKESFQTITGQVLGSPNFMPPEQCGFYASQSGKSAGEKSASATAKTRGNLNLIFPGAKIKAGRYSDVYGLGAILYHLLTGRPPFQGETVPAAIDQVLNAEPVPPRLLRPDVPLDLNTICLKCLEKEPRRRYQTAQEVADEIGRYLRGESIQARPINPIGKVWRWSRRHPATAALVILLNVALLLGMTGILWQWRRAETALKTTEAKASAEASAKAREELARREAEKLYEEAADALNQLVGNPERICRIENLRVVRENGMENEAQIIIDYSYDGFHGPELQVVPVLGKRGERRVSGWFGSEPVVMLPGRGTVTVDVKYFNSEPGVPPACTTDQIRILVLNQSGTAILVAVPFLKRIEWGDPKSPSVPSASVVEMLEDPPLQLAEGMRTRITNVDVVKRRTDRTQMIIGVEYEYLDQLAEPMVGVDVMRRSDLQTSRYFVSAPSLIGKARRNFALIPVHFQPPGSLPEEESNPFSTDTIVVYLAEKGTGRRYNMFRAAMLLSWRAPDALNTATKEAANHIEIEEFKQNDASNGYIHAKYRLLDGPGRIRVNVYDFANPASAGYFTSDSPALTEGSGAKLIEIRIESESKSPNDFIHANTIEVELLDANGKVLARSSKQSRTVWLRPKRNR